MSRVTRIRVLVEPGPTLYFRDADAWRLGLAHVDAQHVEAQQRLCLHVVGDGNEGSLVGFDDDL